MFPHMSRSEGCCLLMRRAYVSAEFSTILLYHKYNEKSSLIILSGCRYTDKSNSYDQRSKERLYGIMTLEVRLDEYKI